MCVRVLCYLYLATKIIDSDKKENSVRFLNRIISVTWRVKSDYQQRFVFLLNDRKKVMQIVVDDNLEFGSKKFKSLPLNVSLFIS